MGAEVARALRDAGHHVVAVCGAPPPAGQPAVKDVLRDLRCEVIEVAKFDRTLDLGVVRRIRNILVREKINYIIGFFVTTDVRHAAIASMGLGIPTISSVQIAVRFHGGKVLQRVKALGFRLVYRRLVAKALCPSELIRNDLASRFGMDPERLEVLPNGINTSSTVQLTPSERSDLRRSLGCEDGEWLLMNVGRIDEQKGQIHLARAAHMLAERGIRFKLLLVGDATAGHPAAIRYAADLDRVIAAGAAAESIVKLGWRDDVMKLHRAVDAYVHSALWEGFPLAVLEAMASGLPVVLTDCAGQLKGFQDEVHGFMVPAGDEHALAKALEQLHGMSGADRARMGAEAQRLVVEKYDVRQIARRFVEVAELLASKS